MRTGGSKSTLLVTRPIVLLLSPIRYLIVVLNRSEQPLKRRLSVISATLFRSIFRYKRKTKRWLE